MTMVRSNRSQARTGERTPEERRQNSSAGCRWQSSFSAGFSILVGLLSSRGATAVPCVPSTGETMVTIGDPTIVCLVVNGLVWTVDTADTTIWYSQVVITPEADDFSRFSVTGSWNSTDVDIDPILGTFGEDVGVHVESNGKFSFQKAFRRVGESKTFPLHTAIISVDEGEVTGITWDDGCHFCGSSTCEDNLYNYDGLLVEEPGQDCYWPDSDCLKDDTEGSVSTLCQLTVYVVWTGTDTKGNYFTSFSKRLSMYAGQSLDTLVDEAKNTYQNTVEPDTD